MTRVLVVHSGNMSGGIERVLETWAESRDLCRDLEPRFALCFEGLVADSLRRRGAVVDIIGRVRVTRPDLVVRARTKLARVIRHDRPDVVFTQSAWSHALFAPVARRLGIPLAMWVHDELTGKPWLERLAGRWQPDLMVCNSRFTERAARTVFPAVHAKTIRYPLSFDEIPDTRAEVRRTLATPGDAVVIVNVARMEPYKGQRTLIDALAQITSATPWVCWLVGGAQRPAEARYQQSLRDAVRAHGLQDRVLFLDRRDDVMALMAAADLHCHPNQGAEPFGLALVEALRSGLPVVATRRGGPAEIVTDGCGRLVPAGDVSALSATLATLIDDPGARRALGAAGPARARELCSPATQLAELQQALDQLPSRAAA
jgi:glycosyltransferase involved in cell wall biosynthesis